MTIVSILGIPIHRITKDEVLKKIENFIRSGRPHHIVTVNPEFVVEAQSNQEFRQILRKADLSIADGIGILFAAAYKRQPIPEKIAGADLVTAIARLAAENGWRPYLVGGQPGVAEATAARLLDQFPNLVIAGAEAGLAIRSSRGQYVFDGRELSRLLKSIKAQKPDILLIAFGAPKQEIFIARYKAKLNVPVMIGVGGTFDFIAGKMKRAPVTIRQLGLEWLWRLIQEPKRWRRIMKAIIIFPLRVLLSR